jgi:phosphate transport system substrate-binding protein
MTDRMSSTPSLERRRFLTGSLAAAAALATQRRPAYAATDTRQIRICGSPRMRPLVDLWIEGFRRIRPDVYFHVDLRGTATAQFGLHLDTGDIAVMNRAIYPYEYYGIYRRSQLLTHELPVATGGIDQVGHSTAIGIFVHRDNPLEEISIPQLDGVFGAERTGGWQGMEWVTSVARGAEGNLRRWGQLGLRGPWADREIIPYGPPSVAPGGVSFFQTRVMGGADTWNPRLQEYPDRNDMLDRLRADAGGIAYAGVAYPAAGLKLLAVAPAAGQPAVRPSGESVRELRYPLFRHAYMYLAPDTVTGDQARLGSTLREFLLFVLSSQGQAAVVPSTGYFPLPMRLAQHHAQQVGGW